MAHATPDAIWQVVPAPPRLREGEVHLWRMAFSEWTHRHAELLPLLSADELDRALRFVHQRDARQQVITHALLRHLLAAYVGHAPDRLRFDAGVAGKPELVPGGLATSLRFNISHSGDWLLIGVTRIGLIGVDVEQWVELDPLALAREAFSPTEREELATLPLEERLPGFFACWSRKEAYIKATGLGVSCGLDYFDVNVAADQPYRLLADRRTPDTVQGWTASDVTIGRGYSAAAVVGGGVATWCQIALDPAARLGSL